MSNSLINETELRKAIEQIHPDNELYEVRIIGKTKKPLSGFFKGSDSLLKALEKVDLRGTNVYFTLNGLDEDLYSRIQHERFVLGGNDAHDEDMLGYDWLFVDLDPKRKEGISSTNEELQQAFAVAKKIYAYLKDYGFEEPVKAVDRKSTRLNSSHLRASRMPSSA